MSIHRVQEVWYIYHRYGVSGPYVSYKQACRAAKLERLGQ